MVGHHRLAQLPQFSFHGAITSTRVPKKGKKGVKMKIRYTVNDDYNTVYTVSILYDIRGVYDLDYIVYSLVYLV